MPRELRETGIETGWISVTSNVVGANIYLKDIDVGIPIWIGQSTGILPFVYAVAPGGYEIILIKTGYYDWGASFVMTAGKTIDIHADMALLTGAVEISDFMVNGSS